MRILQRSGLLALIGLAAAASWSAAISVAPSSLSATLPTGGTDSRTLTIGNTGTGALNFIITAADSSAQARPAPRAASGQAGELAKGALDPPTGDPVLDGFGGPDAFGYRWKDSDEPGGPSFQWIDITETGTIAIAGGDDISAGPFPLGFTFWYYGTGFTTFRVCSNGFLSFSSSSNAYSNSGLPDAGAPPNFIAPLWDDLNVLGQGMVLYANVGDKMVVEWYQVPPYTGSGSFTFEVILSPSGEIVFQYLSLGNPVNSCTAGIQDGTGSNGLQCVFNALYLHPDMAIRLSTTPDWLAVSPNGGTIPPGQQMNLTVALNAGTRCLDASHADIHILSDDPLTPEVLVPVTLTLLPRPIALVSPATRDFSSIYLSQSRTLPLTLTNAGCAPLEVTNLAVSNGIFTFDASPPLSIAAGASLEIHLTATPTAPGPAGGTLTITTDDPARPVIPVTLLCQCISPPVIAVSPAGITETVPLGSTGTRSLTISNTGAGSMDWSIPSPAIQSIRARTAPGGAGGIVERPKLAPDLSTGGPVLNGAGGPDSSGYRWWDSDAPGGPAYNWIEISGTGTIAISGGDDVNAGPFPIGFTFKFYDNDFTAFRICSNGWLSFTSAATAYTNTGLPDTGAPFDFVAPLWDDLNVLGAGKVYYENVGGDLIVEWYQVPPYSGSGAYTFEAIISPSRSIRFQYRVLGLPLNSCTVGIQNGDGTTGLQCAFNADYLHENLCIQFFTLPQWLSVSPAAGHLAPNSSTEVTVSLDTAGLDLGSHTGLLLVQSNDLQTPEVAVPVVLEAGDPSTVISTLGPAADALFQNTPNPANPRTSIRFNLRTGSKADLKVFDVRGGLVRGLVSADLPAGPHDYDWDGRTDQGLDAASGVYFYKLQIGDRSFARRLSLVR